MNTRRIFWTGVFLIAVFLAAMSPLALIGCASTTGPFLPKPIPVQFERAK